MKLHAFTQQGLNSLNQSINRGTSPKDFEKSQEYVDLFNQGFVFYGNYGKREYDSIISERYDSDLLEDFIAVFARKIKSV